LIFVRLFLPIIQLPVLPTLGAFSVGLFLISLFFWDFSLSRQKIWLDCDRKALEVVERNAFLRSLHKIDAPGLADVERRKREKVSGWSLSRTEWPSIIKRIASLESA
jgi:hypothetical protein